MAPFIVNHPTLLNNWVYSRECVLKNIREIKDIKTNQFNIFFNCLKKSIKNVENWNTDSDFQKNKITQLLKDLNKSINFFINLDLNQKYLFNIIYKWAEKNVGEECLEYLVSILWNHSMI